MVVCTDVAVPTSGGVVARGTVNSDQCVCVCIGPQVWNLPPARETHVNIVCKQNKTSSFTAVFSGML